MKSVDLVVSGPYWNLWTKWVLKFLILWSAEINYSNFENATKCVNKSWWYLLKHACFILKLKDFCNTCVHFQWKKTNASRHDRDTVSVAHALRMRDLHDKRHLLVKLRIAGSENSNLIKVVVLAQYWEVGLRWCFSIHWGNIITLMRFALWLTLLLSLVLIRTWNIGYIMLGRVSRDHQRAWNIHSVLKIINLTLSQYTILITLILWLLKCVHFVFNVCSLKHDSTDQSHFHTEVSQYV